MVMALYVALCIYIAGVIIVAAIGYWLNIR
jgi:hypothetical protein